MNTTPSVIRSNKTASYTFLFLFLASLSFLGLQAERHESFWLFTAYFISFFSYVLIVKYCDLSFNLLFVAGVVTRLVLFFSLPGLSDDFYRFIWDGTLLKNGFNPYAYLPRDVLALNIPGLDQNLFSRLNSPNYYTVYPPLNQLIFYISAIIGGPESLLTSVNVIRFLILFAELGTLTVLTRIIKNQSIGNSKVLPFWYFLNPLVILEFTGNLHFEALVIFFIVLALYYFSQRKWLGQGIGLGLAIATKLIPLILLPFAFFRQWSGKGLWVRLLAGAISVVFFIPLYSSALIAGMTTSIGLYFQNFEFNASIYFLIRALGFMLRGFNMIQTIGPWLAITTFILVMAWSLYASWKGKNIAVSWLFVLGIYWLLSTTIHPWYIISMIPLGILAGYYFPIVWSFTIFITYIGYAETDYHISQGWIALEYLLVLAFFIYEWLEKKKDALH